MEIAILILAVSFFIFLFYMFSRAMKTATKNFSEIQHSLGEIYQKLDKLEAIFNRDYRPFRK